MEVINLKARERTGCGKSYARKVRTQGWIPAVCYGLGEDPLKIEVSEREFQALARAKQLTHVVDLGLGDKGASYAVIREIQRNVIKNGVFFHIDFLRVAMDQKVAVEVPIVFSGIPVGVKVDNGVLGHPIKNVMIECLPNNIPENITIDVSELKVGESIHVRDLSIPDIEIKDSPDEVLAVVTPPTREAAATVEEGAEGEESAPEKS